MSRSGYTDDGSDQQMLFWERAVLNAIGGKRGQRFLREMLTALDAMPVRELYTEASFELYADDDPLPPHACCAMGSVALARGMDPEWRVADPEDYAGRLDIADCMAKEIAYLNDEAAWQDETPEQRWGRMRAWVVENLRGGA